MSRKGGGTNGTRDAGPEPDWVDRLLGESPVMRALIDTIGRVATSDAAVLIHGETGTGKEVVAEAIHACSRRSHAPFVVCDLSAVAPSLIESELFGHRKGSFTNADRDRHGAFTLANGGTIFLDELGELDSAVQPRLLRALERKQVKPIGGETYHAVDVRIIAATHRDLEAEIANGRFRSDLYHRLAVVTLRLPPLRERREDIPLLARHFLSAAARSRGIDPPALSEDAVDALCHADWPGNVRQLHNAMERVVSLYPNASLIRADDLGLPPITVRTRKAQPSSGTRPLAPFKDAKDRLLESWEGHYLEDLLVVSEGNLSDAARRAGIARGHLHRLLRKHGVSR